MIGFYNVSVILTYLGVCFALVGCKTAIQGNISIAALCLIASGICDIFDGKVARRIQRTPQECAFGVQIDSLADIVNFAILPVIIGLSIKTPLVICIIYILSAIIRLGYYNTVGLSNGCFWGLPVTFSALFVPLLICINSAVKVNINILYSILMIGLAVFFILPIKVKKPQKTFLVCIIIFELVMGIFLIYSILQN